MAGRPNTPLFELLREEPAAARRDPVSARVAPPEPELKPVLVERHADRTDDWARPAEPRLASTTLVQIPLYAIYVAGALALAVSIAAWSIGWQMGVTKAKDEAVRNTLESEPPVPLPPKSGALLERQSGAVQGAQVPPDGGRRREAPRPQPTGTPPGPKDADLSKPIITATGSIDADPRQPGLNYLVIAQKLDRESAAELVQFLAKSNLEAVGVPLRAVDSSGRPTKNVGLFKVVAVRGVTKEQYRNKEPARTTLQESVIRAGQQWKDPKRGRTDLSTWYWELLVP